MSSNMFQIPVVPSKIHDTILVYYIIKYPGGSIPQIESP